MKIATGIISLVLMLIIAVQSMLVGVGGSMTHNTGYSQGGSVGLLVAFLFLIAGAFAFGKPVVSMVVFVVSALLGFAVAASTGYSDMNVWAVVALLLGGLSLFAWRGDRRRKDAAPQK